MGFGTMLNTIDLIKGQPMGTSGRNLFIGGASAVQSILGKDQKEKADGKAILNNILNNSMEKTKETITSIGEKGFIPHMIENLTNMTPQQINENIAKQKETQEETPSTGEQDETSGIIEENETIRPSESLIDKYKDYQKELWEREDAIRKETQEREDTAYQRAVEDMRRAGINPNLIGVNPSASGGGITQATSTLGNFNNEFNTLKDYAVAQINNVIKESEGDKSRITQGIGDIIDLIGTIIIRTALKK